MSTVTLYLISSIMLLVVDLVLIAVLNYSPGKISLYVNHVFRMLLAI